MNADNRNRFSCMTSFWHLNGYRKQCVFIGDHPDARASSPLIKDRIKHNWPSQRSKKYKHGYIELQSGKKLNLETQTIYGKPAYIFDCTHKIESYCRQQTAEQKIRDSVNNKLSGDDRNTDFELFSERVRDNCGLYMHAVFERDQLLGQLQFIGLRDLEDLAALLSMPDAASNPSSAIVPKAA